MEKKPFSFYSNSCGGQNRKKTYFSITGECIEYPCTNRNYVNIFRQHSGHSQNEADGMHSRIEQTSD